MLLFRFNPRLMKRSVFSLQTSREGIVRISYDNLGSLEILANGAEGSG